MVIVGAPGSVGGALARRWLSDTGVCGTPGVGSERVLVVVSGSFTSSVVNTGVSEATERAVGCMGLPALTPFHWVVYGLAGDFGDCATSEPREARGELGTCESCEPERSELVADGGGTSALTCA